ncbi:MAG: mannose-1-phosphate guanylyltransferase/mannose-6-phosphate isomerase [Burkholderiaceae bacterium]
MLIPVILSGGSGSRLWPVSREAFPKPFMRLGGELSLLQRTLQRCLPLADGGVLGIVTNQEYQFRTQEEFESLPGTKQLTCTQLLEPAGRNTAPAIALAALWAIEQHPDAVLLILPADHLIPDETAFQRCARDAARAAAGGALVTFGIQPTAPETGFGYIEMAPVTEGASADAARPVRRFIEKPDAARAAQFLASGNFVWNSGMFCFKAQAILTALETHAPDVATQARLSWQVSRAAATNATRILLDAASFGACRDVSIDYAVMEHAPDVQVLPARFGWSDIGSWKAVAEQFDADPEGNTHQGDALFINAHNTHVQSDDRLVAAVGVDNLLVVDTPDALLVASKDASQQVKEIVARLKSSGHEAARLHRTVARPWGSYTVLQEGPRFKIKRIEVRPGQSLSLQMHHHRSEHWIVVSGTARVSCDERTFLVAANESTYIPIGSRHRLENPGVMQLVMIEVQCGDYLGEDDIVRFEDRYGRTS